MDAESRPFVERPTETVVEDAWRFAALPLAAAAVCGALGASLLAWALLLVAGGVVAFFRNPERLLAGDECTAVAPADGRVIEVVEFEDAAGRKRVRIAIFLSIFDVHVNRSPLAGRVLSVERDGDAFLAAWNPDALQRNVRCAMELETEEGVRFVVRQVTGLVARRIVCHPQVGDVLRRGERFGLIRFGSRTDLELPVDAEVLVVRGDRVRGGATPLAHLAVPE